MLKKEKGDYSEEETEEQGRRREREGQIQKECQRMTIHKKKTEDWNRGKA